MRKDEYVEGALTVAEIIRGRMELEKTEEDDGITITPVGKKHTKTLIFMHGLGDTALGFYDIFYEVGLLYDAKVVLLTAPEQAVSINMGMVMPSWYDIKSLELNKNQK